MTITTAPTPLDLASARCARAGASAGPVPEALAVLAARTAVAGQDPPACGTFKEAESYPLNLRMSSLWRGER